MNRIFFAILIFFGSTGLLFGQDCENAILEADNLISSGNVEQVPGVLNNCLSELSRENKVEAYKRLTIAYLYMDDPYGAETSFLALLEIDPEFRVGENDPIELKYLSQQYITTPIISWALKVGGNVSTVSIIHRNTTEAEYDDIRYRPKGGFNFSGGVDLYLSNVVSLFAEVEASMWQYDKVSTTLMEEPHELSSIRQNFQAAIPIGLRLTYPVSEASFPYIYGGYHPAYTFLSRVTDERIPSGEGERPKSTFDLTNYVNKFNHSIILGVGYKQRIGRRFGYKYILVDLRYRMGMTNITNEKNYLNLSNEFYRDHVTKFLQLDDDYRWNSLELTLGYVWPQYKARKKNSVTIQTVLKKWFSKKNKNE